jgi:hypothetical protein
MRALRSEYRAKLDRFAIRENAASRVVFVGFSTAADYAAANPRCAQSLTMMG